MQPVPITTKVVSLNPAHGEVLLIQHYVIKLVSDLRQVGGFLRFSPPIKLTHDITEILLKVAFNTNKTNKKPKTTHLSQVTDKFYHKMFIEYTSTWAWFKLTMLAVIGTDCISSCKSNTIITMPALRCLCVVHTSIQHKNLGSMHCVVCRIFKHQQS